MMQQPGGEAGSPRSHRRTQNKGVQGSALDTLTRRTWDKLNLGRMGSEAGRATSPHTPCSPCSPVPLVRASLPRLEMLASSQGKPSSVPKKNLWEEARVLTSPCWPSERWRMGTKEAPDMFREPANKGTCTFCSHNSVGAGL